MMMANPTLEALKRIEHVLRDAGWDRRPEPIPSLSEEDRPKPIPSLSKKDMAALRHAYSILLRSDYLQILEETLRKGATIEEAAQAMGLSTEQAVQLFTEALDRLDEFVEQVKDQGTTSSLSEG